MQADIFLVFRVLSATVFFVTLVSGYYIWKNSEKLFGHDPHVPSETGSSRAYSKVQVYVIWAHILLASAAFALLLH